MNTIKTIFAVLFIGLFLQSCDDPFSGSDTIITEERTLDAFTGLDINGVFDTKVIRGDESKIIITANDNLMDRITTEVSAGVLELNLAEGNYRDIEIDVTIFTPSIDDIDLNGVGGLDIFGFSDLETLTLDHTGLGEIIISNGSAKTLIFDMDNVGSLEAFDFEVEEVIFEITGVGAARVTTTSKLTGELAGVGNLYYKGTPEIDVEINGIGDVVDAN